MVFEKIRELHGVVIDIKHQKVRNNGHILDTLWMLVVKDDIYLKPDVSSYMEFSNFCFPVIPHGGEVEWKNC